MPDTDIVILAAVRTAHGRFQGGFSGTSAVDLAAVVMKEVLLRADGTECSFLRSSSETSSRLAKARTRHGKPRSRLASPCRSRR